MKNDWFGASYSRLQGVVGPLVGGGELPSAVLLGPGDPAEPVVVALGPPLLGLGQPGELVLPAALLEHRDLVGALTPDELLLVLLLGGVGLEEGGDLGLEVFDADHGRDGRWHVRGGRYGASRWPGRIGARTGPSSQQRRGHDRSHGHDAADTLRVAAEGRGPTPSVTRAKGGRTTSHARSAGDWDPLTTAATQISQSAAPSHGRTESCRVPRIVSVPSAGPTPGRRRPRRSSAVPTSTTATSSPASASTSCEVGELAGDVVLGEALVAEQGPAVRRRRPSLPAAPAGRPARETMSTVGTSWPRRPSYTVARAGGADAVDRWAACSPRSWAERGPPSPGGR